jgi:hypothetical protein
MYLSGYGLLLCSFDYVRDPSAQEWPVFSVLWIPGVLFMRVRKIAKSYYCPRPVCPSTPLSAWKSATTKRIFMKFDIWLFLENKSGKSKLH